MLRNENREQGNETPLTMNICLKTQSKSALPQQPQVLRRVLNDGYTKYKF